MAEGNTIKLGEMTDAIGVSVKASVLSALQEHSKSQKPEPQPVTAKQEQAPVTSSDPTKAQMSAFGIASTFEMVDNFKVPVLNVSLPWLSAPVGLGLGAMVGEMIDRVMPPKNADGSNNFINPVLQIAAAGLEMKMMPGIVGPTAAKFMAGAHAAKLVLRYTPLQGWLMQLEGILSKPVESIAGAAKSVVGAGQGYSQDMSAPMSNGASPAFAQSAAFS